MRTTGRRQSRMWARQLLAGLGLLTTLACGASRAVPEQIPAPSPLPAAPSPTEPPQPPAPEAPRGDTSLLVLAEADTREAAQARLAELQTLLEGISETFPLRPGFPTVLETDGLPGLPPGRFVAVAGACPIGEAKIHRAALAALVPGSAAPAVVWSRPEPACPDLGEAPGQGRGLELPMTASAGRLTVVAFPYTYVEDGGEAEEKSWTALAILRDGAGRVVAVETASSRGAFALLEGVSASGQGVVVRDRWSNDSCAMAESITVSNGSTRFEVKGEAIEVQTTDTDEREQSCPRPEALGPED